MSADGPDPSGDFGRGRSIIDQNTGEYADVVGGALKTTLSGTVTVTGSENQGDPNTPDKAWPVKPTDAAGVNQQAITSAGDAKITLDGEVVPVTGPLTDAQLRASAVPISTTQTLTVIGSGATLLASQAKQSDGSQKTQIVGATGNVAVVSPSGAQNVSIVASSTTVATVGTETENAAPVNLKNAVLGAKANAAVPTWSENAYVPASVDLSGRLRVDRSAVQPISAASLPLPTGAATDTKQDTGNLSLSSLDSKIGTLESKPSAYSVLDRLYQLGVKLDAINQAHVRTDNLLKKIVPPAPAPSVLLLRHPLGRF
jgi:hypothetical protein